MLSLADLKPTFTPIPNLPIPPRPKHPRLTLTSRPETLRKNLLLQCSLRIFQVPTRSWEADKRGTDNPLPNRRSPMTYRSRLRFTSPGNPEKVSISHLPTSPTNTNQPHPRLREFFHTKLWTTYLDAHGRSKKASLAASATKYGKSYLDLLPCFSHWGNLSLVKKRGRMITSTEGIETMNVMSAYSWRIRYPRAMNMATSI